MAESIQYRPPQTRQLQSESRDELAHLEGRLAELNALLDELYDSGLIRWLKDFVGALPQLSEIALDGVNTERGHAGLRNVLILGRQLGRVDPDRLQAVLDSADLAFKHSDDGAGRYNPPGLTGALRLLRDEELWSTLAPLIAAAKAFSAASRGSGKPDMPSENKV